MDKLISSFQLQKQTVDVFPKNFEIFLYVNFDKEYQRHTLFIQALLCKYVDSLDTIMADLDTISDDNIFLRNNMIEPLLLNNWTTS